MSFLLYPEIYSISKVHYECIKRFTLQKIQSIYNDFCVFLQLKDGCKGTIKEPKYEIPLGCRYIVDIESSEKFKTYLRECGFSSDSLVRFSVDIVKYHIQGDVGGGIHCLTKNTFNIPLTP